MNLEQFHGKKKRFSSETVIFEEGDPSDYMYIVVSGQVVIYKKVIENATRILHNIGNGEYFGEMALITGAKRSASAKTIEETEVVQIDKNGLNTLLKNEPDFGINLMRQMAERLAKTSENLIYSELEMALSHRKPERFAVNYPGKILFVATGSFRLENKKNVMKTLHTLKWPDNVDVIASLFKPGKAEEGIIFIIAVDNSKTLLNLTLHFDDLVNWDFSPVLPANTEELAT